MVLVLLLREPSGEGWSGVGVVVWGGGEYTENIQVSTVERIVGIVGIEVRVMFLVRGKALGVVLRTISNGC